MPHVIFPTPFGICGLAWDDSRVVRFQLPEATEALTRSRLSRGGDPEVAEAEVPPWVRQALGLVRAHLGGEPRDLSGIALDWSLVSDFQRAVYLQAQAIPPGSIRSYGEVARALALGPESARAVGVALATNPWPLLVPCHRVVSAGGKMTGFSAPGGVRTKTRLLALEGAELLSE